MMKTFLKYAKIAFHLRPHEEEGNSAITIDSFCIERNRCIALNPLHYRRKFIHNFPPGQWKYFSIFSPHCCFSCQNEKIARNHHLHSTIADALYSVAYKSVIKKIPQNYLILLHLIVNARINSKRE
jgi:hypothetical protein